MAAPESYVQWINENLGFNPRSQAASNALSDMVVADLRAACPILNQAFLAGELTPRKNVSVRTTVVERNVDLVIQSPAVALETSRIAVEHKTIMTAHGKARKNRYGDIIAYANHMHPLREVRHPVLRALRAAVSWEMTTGWFAENRVDVIRSSLVRSCSMNEGSISTPMAFLSHLNAANNVVPVPMKGSRIVSPGKGNIRISR